MINYFQESFEPIVTNIKPEDFKLEINRSIYQKILESPAEESEKILQMISNIENQEIQSHVSEILVSDYEITSVSKCIEELISYYEREHLINKRNDILKRIENENDKSKYDELAKQLSEVVNTLARMK